MRFRQGGSAKVSCRRAFQCSQVPLNSRSHAFGDIMFQLTSPIRNDTSILSSITQDEAAAWIAYSIYKNKGHRFTFVYARLDEFSDQPNALNQVGKTPR